MKFRKKPIVIEAFQMTEEMYYGNFDFAMTWPSWLLRAFSGERDKDGTIQEVMSGSIVSDPLYLEIVTLEGNHRVSRDDWIIQGIKGELYPCKPDIFEATYEPVDEEKETTT